MNIYLVGYRCTGKTTIGKALAKLMNRPFMDTDEQIVKENRMTIAQMVEQNSWEYFREKERNAVVDVGEKKGHVVATGGGVILDDGNIKVMKKTGFVVWLNARPETIKKWMFKDENTKDNRPSLTSKSLMEEIDQTLSARMPLYEKAGDLKVDTDDFDIHRICTMISRAFARHAGNHKPKP